MNGVSDQGQGEKPHGPLRLETESRNGHGVEIAVPRPQPAECGRHVMSPRCEPHEGDPAAQPPPGGYGNESAHTGDQEEAREASQRDRAEELGQRISRQRCQHAHRRVDRKSTRLNSSHLVISYAVFCLKKKKKKLTPAAKQQTTLLT